jgi:hypothetical protein
MTIEPGYYLGDSHGIRIENQVEIVESRPGFCKFASLTLIPIDLSQVELHLLSEQEKQWLDAYHQQVREALSPLVNSDARPWLVEATAPIGLYSLCGWCPHPGLSRERVQTLKTATRLPFCITLRRKAKSLL